MQLSTNTDVKWGPTLLNMNAVSAPDKNPIKEYIYLLY